MTKPHWTIATLDSATEEPVYSHGCQHDTCDNPATVQWQRAATPDEANAYIHSIHQGEHTTVTVAVFACDDHAAPPAQASVIHDVECPAPGGCACA